MFIMNIIPRSTSHLSYSPCPASSSTPRADVFRWDQSPLSEDMLFSGGVGPIDKLSIILQLFETVLSPSGQAAVRTELLYQVYHSGSCQVFT